ncbi:MAG: GNAT family N-acetyltransferase [Marinoscillum sp.]
MEITIEILNNCHHKKEFDCGHSMLNNYIQQQAKQDVKRVLSACFVLSDRLNQKVIGYYTLSSNPIPKDDFPDHLIKKMPPSYVNLPTILLGRLAIDKDFKGNGYGGLILIDALNRCVEISQNLGTLAVVVDSIDSNATNFYDKYGFIELSGTGKMFIPIKTVEQSILNEG